MNSKDIVEELAKQICEVQPMPNDCMKNLIDSACDKTELIERGYRPISRLGLLWIREEE